MKGNENMIDVYYLENYGINYEQIENGSFELLHFRSEYGEVVYPVIIRNIEGTKYKDLITPYGYGGPLISSTSDSIKLMENFDIYMTNFCKDHDIVSEAIRFHPLLKNYTYCKRYCECKFIRETITIDLMKEDLLMNEVTKKTRNQIRKAIKQGIQIDFDYDSESLAKFVEMYYSTMNRNNAEQYYYFTKEFFEQAQLNLKHNSFIINALYKGEIISSSMFLHSDKFLHYHFSATNKDFYYLCPVDLILYSAMEWGKKAGVEKFHLGGGYRDNDSLFKFKKGFSKEGRSEFWFGKKIRNEKIYELLVQNSKNENEDFFPAYR